MTVSLFLSLQAKRGNLYYWIKYIIEIAAAPDSRVLAGLIGMDSQ
jgi:hypothetical protein